MAFVKRMYDYHYRLNAKHPDRPTVSRAVITRRFGSLPDWARVRIAEADDSLLDTWAMQILDAQRIEDVFA